MVLLVASMVLLTSTVVGVMPTPQDDHQSSYMVNPYHVLQVRHDATVSEIRQNYRRLALWHHPGRCHNLDETELQRRFQIFGILAACYETLLQNGNEYNVCLHSSQHFPLKGEFHVGGKKLSVLSFEDEEENYEVTIDNLVQTRRGHEQSGGPLELLYKARHYKPFTDPYIVFEKVFGHAVFEKPLPYSKFLILDETISTTSPAAIWTGSTTKLRDGTVVTRTSRTMQNVRITKTETSTVDSKGQTHVYIQVTSEQVHNDMNAVTPKGSCALCHPYDDSIEDSSMCSWPEMSSSFGWLGRIATE